MAVWMPILQWFPKSQAFITDYLYCYHKRIRLMRTFHHITDQLSRQSSAHPEAHVPCASWLSTDMIAEGWVPPHSKPPSTWRHSMAITIFWNIETSYCWVPVIRVNGGRYFKSFAYAWQFELDACIYKSFFHYMLLHAGVTTFACHLDWRCLV